MGFLQSLLGKRPTSAAVPFSREIVASASLDKALLALSQSATRNRDVLNALRQTSKYLRQQHGLRMRRHVGPDGEAWPKALFKTDELPEPKLNRAGPIRGNSFYNLGWGNLTTEKMVARSREIVDQLRRTRAGKAGEMRLPALYRPQKYGNFSTAGEVWKYKGRKGSQTKEKIPVTGVLFGMLTKDKVGGSANRIHAKAGSYELTYGLGPGASRWASIHQYGNGTFRGKAVPRRAFLGMNQTDVAHILRIFSEAQERINAGKAIGA